MLRAFSHVNVYVLDGGLSKWKAEGRAVEKSDVGDWEADFDYELDTEMLIDYHGVKKNCEEENSPI